MIPELEKQLEDVTNAILSSIDTHIPACKPSPYAKRWWTLELDEQNASVKHLANTAYTKRQQCTHPIHAQLKEAHNHLTTNIQLTEEHWIEYLENVEATTYGMYTSIWSTNPQTLSFRTSQTYELTPITPSSDQTNQEKSELLYKAFFKPTSNQPFETPTDGYPDPVCTFTNITDEQVERSIS